MSQYKIQVKADSNQIGGHWDSDTIDLVDDWGYDEDDAKELYEVVKKGIIPSELRLDVENAALTISGFEYWAEAVD
jgi:hypothetical protein